MISSESACVLLVNCWGQGQIFEFEREPCELSLPGSTEFGSFWKILEKIVLQLPEWSANWLKDVLSRAPVFV